jgi:GTP-binding protein HflX
LIDAFKSTLVETAEADLLFHVVDWSSPGRENQINEVNKVLTEIGAHRVPQIIVYNKIDRTPEAPGIVRSPCGKISSIKLSSLTGEGVDLFRSEFRSFVQPLVAEKLSIVEAEL